MIKKVEPQKGYETECWSSDAEKRGKLLRETINPHNHDIKVYYPASGGETIISRFIGAGTHIQVNKAYEHGSPFLKRNAKGDLTPDGKPDEDGQRREYKVQWLNVIDYWGDALTIRPSEVLSGIEVYIDKWNDFALRDNPQFKAYIYNLIREGGYVIDCGHQNFFIGINPALFGFEMVLDVEKRSCAKGDPRGLSILKKCSGLYISETLFEADLLIGIVREDRRMARSFALKGWNYTSKIEPRSAKEKLEDAISKTEDPGLAADLEDFLKAFFSA
ncbi:MAG TPA: hypothetical protein VJI46_05260 [Candidatus Nanoarchaeia archaeon]|nr:hypothetical protein [Candidatus Nanoarchaeia archaeon]